jgi:bacillithiol synthase
LKASRKLAAAGTALDAELTTLLEWMRAQDAGLGRSAETAASKMRYQMNRLRTLAANFQLQREASLGRHAEAICQGALSRTADSRSGCTARRTTLPATALSWPKS